MNFRAEATSLGKIKTAEHRFGEWPPRNGRGPSLLWMPLLAIAATAFAAEIPFFFLGTPSGHDVEFHLYSWLEILSQWKQGIFYPRWAGQAHFGYGEPRFVFYPPASWTLGGLLTAVFPWTITASIYVWLVLVAAGISMFVLARRWLARRDAIFAAMLYAASPYHLVIVYWRSAFAELLASCLVPLLLLCVLRAVDGRRRAMAGAIIPLALVLAAAWLTNAPAAVMAHYSLALLLLFFAWQRRSASPIFVGAAAVGLGALLSAFYLLPAIYEQRWIDIAQAVSAGSRPSDNFLFIHTTDADHDNFNHIISWIAVLEMVLTFAAVAGARHWRETRRELWTALLGWAAACSVLLFPVSAVLWKILPKMQFMQFPWRWLLCLSMIFSLLVSSLFVTQRMRLWWWRAAVTAISILVIAIAWHRIQPPWWDNAGDLREMQDNMDDRIGYEGTDEYTPSGADPNAINKETNARNVTVVGAARTAIRVLRWDAELKIFTADMSAPDQLALRLFRYPAWQAEVNGRVVETASGEAGQMLVPVETGMNRVQISFVRTWDRSAGGWISLLTMLSIVVWSVRGRRLTLRPQTSDLGPGLSGSEVGI